MNITPVECHVPFVQGALVGVSMAWGLANFSPWVSFGIDVYQIVRVFRLVMRRGLRVWPSVFGHFIQISYFSGFRSEHTVHLVRNHLR